jgi:hypothetical protein
MTARRLSSETFSSPSVSHSIRYLVLQGKHTEGNMALQTRTTLIKMCCAEQCKNMRCMRLSGVCVQHFNVKQHMEQRNCVFWVKVFLP